MTNHQITIQPTIVRGERGQRYRVTYQGTNLINETWCPELEAARVLMARGIVGRLEVWRYGKSHPDLIIQDIARAAALTVEESEKLGPRLIRWRPRPEDLPLDVVSPSAGIAPAAVLESGDPPLRRKETEPAE